MAAPYTYFTRTAGNLPTTTALGPQVRARREAGDTPNTDVWPDAARFRYTHASAAVSVMDQLPIGSVLQETRATD